MSAAGIRQVDAEQRRAVVTSTAAPLAAGPVIVPDELAGEVLRALIRDITRRVRASGGTLSPGCQRLLYALDAADRRHTSFAPETGPADPVKLDVLTVAEAARRLECSPQYVRSLARRGLVAGRRTAAGWLIEAASLHCRRTGAA